MQEAVPTSGYISGGLTTHEKSVKSKKSAFSKFNRREFYFILFVIILVIVSLCAVFLLTPLQSESSSVGSSKCFDTCQLTLVESIPENLTYPRDSPIHLDTYESWSQLIDNASYKLDIGSYYWTMRQEDVIEDPSAWKGEEIFSKLLDAGNHALDIRIAQNNNSDPKQMLDTQILANEGAADVRTLDFSRLLGGGIIHTKMWLADSSSFYVGSANLDWRALTQVKELGIMVSDCSCMGSDLQKVFDVYWMLGKPGAEVPSEWPGDLNTNINMENPMLLAKSNLNETMYISVAPPSFLPGGRTSDVTAVLNIIDSAEDYIYIAVMDYYPVTLYQKQNIYWPIIDDRLRAAAFERGVQVRLMPSWWKHSSDRMKHYLQSLASINPAVKGSVEVKLFEVPVVTPAQAEIPYSRVNHNKYMVTEKTALITTSNWSGDYFIDTAGVSVVVSQTDGSSPTEKTIHMQLKAVFDRDWNSPYAKYIDISGL